MNRSVRDRSDFSLLRRTLGYTHPYRVMLSAAVFFTVVHAFLAPVRPVLVQFALDHYIFIPDPRGLLFITLAMIALLCLEAVFQFCATYLTNSIGQSAIRDMRIQVFRHIGNFRLRYFDRTPIGTLVTRVVSDIEMIAEMFSQGFLIIIGDLLQLAAVVIVIFVIDWRLALISLSTTPVLIAATWIFKNAIGAAFQEVRTQVARLNAFVQEHISGMSIVQVFSREMQELEKFMKINAEHRNAHLRTVWIFSIFFPVVEILSAVSLGLLVWWGAKNVIGGYVTFGTLVAFILYIYMLFRPIRMLADRFNTFQHGMVSAGRVYKVLDMQESLSNEGSINPERLRGEVEFRDVWFSYDLQDGNQENKDATWALRGISFRVEPGEMVAIVGATGSGKTSVINLLSRFYEVSRGKITMDGSDLNQYDLRALRKNIAVVMQDVFLFSDSIMNNITLRNGAITPERVVEAAREVGVHSIFSKLPGGYDYFVGERGAILSAGQRQLVAFLRAYVHNPPVLVLDEATSSVDSEAEMLISHTLLKLTAHRTSIVIAHRLATVRASHKIIVLEEGRIAESGSHEQLLTLGGHYRKLYEHSMVNVYGEIGGKI